MRYSPCPQRTESSVKDKKDQMSIAPEVHGVDDDYIREMLVIADTFLEWHYVPVPAPDTCGCSPSFFFFFF